MKLRNKSLGRIGHGILLQLSARWMLLVLGLSVLSGSAAAQNQSVPEKGEGNPTTQNHANNDKSGGTGRRQMGTPLKSRPEPSPSARESSSCLGATIRCRSH